jgi:dTDP-4-dehydrorhamnose 3,5-epimerase
VIVDVRVGSPTFGQAEHFVLDAEAREILLIPAGFAHGFLVQSELAVVLYKFTDTYRPEHELGVRFDDPDLGIAWPLPPDGVALSPRDAGHPRLRDVPTDRLPRFHAV